MGSDSKFKNSDCQTTATIKMGRSPACLHSGDSFAADFVSLISRCMGICLLAHSTCALGGVLGAASL